MPLKQELKNAVKISRKTFFNPAGWFGYKLFANQIDITASLVKGLFVPAKVKRIETFEQAMHRLQLKEADLARIYKNYVLYSICFLSLGAILVGYGLYLSLQRHSVAGFFLSIAASGLSLTNAFRYHFLAFQIRKRKLGCTFKEWLANKVEQRGE